MDVTESQPIPASSPKPSRGWGQRLLRAAVLYVLVPYLAVTLIFILFQRKLLYRPTVAERLNVSDVGLDPDAVRDVLLQTSDGEKLKGSIKSAVSLIEPLMLIIMGLIIGTSTIALLLPIFRISTLVGH